MVVKINQISKSKNSYKPLFILGIMLFIIGFTKAQPPTTFNYSAVARNVTGQPIANSTIGIQISILKTSTIGDVKYSENHIVKTDAFGLFNLVIGAGAIQSGSFSSIDWSNDNYFLKVGMDANGGTNFLAMGTTQFMSVPYALHAKTAETLVGGGSSSGNFKHFIGEQFGGGIIFHLWKDNTGAEHGLIVDLNDLSTSQVWSNVDLTLIGPSAQSSWDGLSNSNAIVAQSGHSSSAALLCLNSTNGGQNDWYLPSVEELNLLVWQNRFILNKALESVLGTTILPLSAKYWSSTELLAGYVWHFFLPNNGINDVTKNSLGYVRAIRAF